MSNSKRSRKDNVSADIPTKRQRRDPVCENDDIPVKRCAPAVLSLFGAYRVCLQRANITKLAVDIIVNLTDKKLEHKSGLARAISKAAGYKLADECKAIIKEKGKMEETQVVKTAPGFLPCKAVLHAVVPKWRLFKILSKKTYLLQLTKSLQNAQKFAFDNGFESIALSPNSASYPGLTVNDVALAIYNGITKDIVPGTPLTVYVVETKNDVLDRLIELLYQNNMFKPERPSVVLSEIQKVNIELRPALSPKPKI